MTESIRHPRLVRRGPTRSVRPPPAIVTGRPGGATFAAAALLSAVLLGCCWLGAAGARAAAWLPHRVVVGYAPASSRAVAGHRVVGADATRARAQVRTVVERLGRHQSVSGAVRSLRDKPGVAYAYPDYVAHAAGAFYPDDPGVSHTRRGWERMQWNMLTGTGVDAPRAWSNLLADQRAGGKGVSVAVLDTGVAYRDWGRFAISPDFRGARFVAPYDFVAHNRFPLDRSGHGTFVAGVIGERTNNGVGLTGLAYGTSIMPVRVLNESGEGAESTIADGIRYAVRHGARVINLSLEFLLNRVRSASQIPLIVQAVKFALRHRVVIVAASGNDNASRIAFPARIPGVISVGATTKDGCAASYSNSGPALDLVAPGGGDDAVIPSDPACHPDRVLPPVYQLTLSEPPLGGLPGNFDTFGYPGVYVGTSMAAPEVSAAAALVIASHVLGPDPTPAQVLRRLERTATPLPAGVTAPNLRYGYGLVDAGAATSRPPATTSPTG
jgi:serine protease